jgi:phosphatidylglycerophosphatase C
VVFDFDGVLIRGDSYAHLVREELRRSPRRRLAMLPVLALAMPMLKVPALRRHGQRLVVRVEHGQVQQARSRFWPPTRP